MHRRSLKLAALVFFGSLCGVLFSGYETHADGEKKPDILKRLENYRLWKQIKKSENSTSLTISLVTSGTFQIDGSSIAG